MKRQVIPKHCRGMVESLEQRRLLSAVPVGPESRVNTYTTNDQRIPTVAMDPAGNFVVAWQSYGQEGGIGLPSLGIYAQRYNAAGAAQGAEFRVNTHAVFDQR